MAESGWTVTLHCDLGCDEFITKHDQPPFTELQRYCAPTSHELRQAQQEHEWWYNMLGDHHYRAFFDTHSHKPKANFRKIQHLQVNIVVIKLKRRLVELC